LPVDLGVVVGAESGRLKNELNFFTQLLHDKGLDDCADIAKEDGTLSREI